MGHLVPISGVDQRTGQGYDYWAFVPNPLPETIQLQPATWTQVAITEAALARLDQASQQIPDAALLRGPALRREAQSTSALEGTYAPFEEVLESDIENREQLPLEVREVLNFVVAAELGCSWEPERALTSGFIGTLQRTLVQGTRDEHSDSGRVRDRQVVVGPRNAPIAEARFVPPPPGEPLRADFEQWVEWVATPRDLPLVVRAAMAHYQFETLHPFSDGNGRIGRLLVVLQVIRGGPLGEPILVVSPWFEDRRDDYQAGLLELSRTGDWDSWIQFFATGIAAAADSTRLRIDGLLSWRDNALTAVREHGISGVAERLAGELIGKPLLTAPGVAQEHQISRQAAINALRRLVEVNLVVEVDRNGRKMFRAPQVIELLSG